MEHTMRYVVQRVPWKNTSWRTPRHGAFVVIPREAIPRHGGAPTSETHHEGS